MLIKILNKIDNTDLDSNVSDKKKQNHLNDLNSTKKSNSINKSKGLYFS